MIPLVVLASCAAVIASQAVISGAFSLTRAAIQMGYCPRLAIDHTSERQIGQIYVPFVNWVLFTAVILLVAGAALVAAYPCLSNADFPVASLVIYSAGMVFISMPLCLLYESALKVHELTVAGGLEDMASRPV